MNLALVTALLSLILAILVFLAWRILGQKTDDGGRVESALRSEMAQNRSDVGSALKNSNDTVMKRLDALLDSSEKKLESVRLTVEKQLEGIQRSNEKKLEDMRQTVDEKLHDTLEKRLGQSFMLVSDRLEQVQKGLGEMQALATGVGDLKKVLMNVKTRGIAGEHQLKGILEQILTPDQYSENVITKSGSSERVEFAIRLPEGVWLPVDAKFPQEYYEKLVDARHHGNEASIEEAVKQLSARVRDEAAKMKDKYIDPPNTTDFGVLFVPFEAIYAEIQQIPGLWSNLQRDYQITITGPTTMSAFLNSLQMGFRTLVIQKRSSEVWTVLGEVKTEFGKFGDILEKTQKKLVEATNTIEGAARKSRTIEKRLKGVQQMPGQAPEMLEDASGSDSALEDEKIA